MRNEIKAVYKGKEYKASMQSDNIITLISTNKEDEVLGFSLYKGGYYIKSVKQEEVSEVFKKEITAIYKGYTARVLQEKGQEVLIEIDNILYETSLMLEMDKATDKGVYVKWVQRDQLVIHIERRRYTF